MTKRLIVNSEEALKEAILSNEKEGLRLAVMSNTGLPRGYMRLTFLPASSFKDNKKG